MSYIIDTSKLEQIKHKVTSINENSTDLEYPSAKAVYTALEGFTPPPFDYENILTRKLI